MVRTMLVATIRRAHLISPSGPGALTLLPNRVSVIVTAPAAWMRSRPDRPAGSVSVLDELSITDRHLQTATLVNRFVQPPAAENPPVRDRDWVLPAARFPLMDACANPQCQRLIKRDNTDSNEGRCAYCASGRRRWPTFQVATVLACQDGHLSDVDWVGVLHDGEPCGAPQVRYSVGASPARPRLKCETCHRELTFDPEQDFPCPGERPWLPGAGAQDCQLRARPIERSSTTMYYAQQMSALTLPVAGATNSTLVHALLDNPALAPLRRLDAGGRRVDTLAEIVRIAGRLGITTTRDEVVAHLDALGSQASTPPSRAAELDALTSDAYTRHVTGHLPDLIVERPDPAGYDTRLGKMLTGVSAVTRLRETRILTGFSRIEPAPADPIRGYEQMWGKEHPQTFAADARDDWLPGYRVYGEGILIVLDEQACQTWAAAAAHEPRVLHAARNLPITALDPVRGVLAHTMAHLLMRALAPHSGYPLPALRERLFVSDTRTAFLIYTAAGDIHGTLGGLVELAAPDRLSLLLDEAINSADWCSTDPVCGEGHPHLGGRGTTPGACHHCLYVPETSCEAFNQGLDRKVVTDLMRHLGR